MLGAVLLYVVSAAYPFGLIPIAMCLEGVVRALAGAVGQGCGVLPLWLVDRVLYGSTAAIASARELPAEVDRVEHRVDAEGKPTPGYRIRSSHDHGWTSLTTVELHGELWRVLDDRHDLPSPKPHGWTLGPLTPGWIIRGAAVRYHPRAHVQLEARARVERAETRRAVATQLVQLPPIDVGALLAVLLAPFVSLLPARTRARLRLEGVPVVLATFLTGLVELGLGVVAWPLAALNFGLFSAPNVLVLYLLFEGVVRTTAGFAQIPCGTMIGWIIERMVLGSAYAFADLRQLAPIRDELEPVPGGYEIRSCRHRRWRETTTIVIERVPHRIVNVQERSTELRPWIYTLAPTPDGWIDREWIEYDTGLVLDELTRMPHARDAPPE